MSLGVGAKLRPLARIDSIYLASAKRPKDNLSLRKNKDIVILKADKGNATVVMNRTDYDQKMQNMLQDANTYRLLPKDPAKSTETKMKTLLSGMKEKITQVTYKNIMVTDGITPTLYGIPKIHKEGTPMRPIVSYIGSPTYQLSKYLVSILSPVVGNNRQHHLCNTK